MRGLISKSFLSSIVVSALAISGCENQSFFAELPPEPPSSSGGDSSLSGQNLDGINSSDICLANPSAPACSLAPAVQTAGVVTVLFTMDQIPDQSAQLILANAIKYASPVQNPRILFLKDSDLHGEDIDDIPHIKNDLLADYDYVSDGAIPAGGLLANTYNLQQFDLIIISNPGYPLQNEQTLNTLKNNFKNKGVILLGDDMAGGGNFNASLSSFTGLTYVNYGGVVSCGANNYMHDNLAGYSYRVTMGSQFFQGIDPQFLSYDYGNDIDKSVALPGTEVLALAGPDVDLSCASEPLRPVIARRPRPVE